MRRSLKLFLVTLFGTALLVGGAPTARAAGPWYVAVTGADTNDCLTPATACATIGAAITMASAGDTINVAAGTYPEYVAVNTANLTILGAQAGVDARTRPGTDETIIQVGTSVGAPAVLVQADGVTIDGFTIQGATGSAGIILAPSYSGNQVLNNIIQNNTIGLFPGSSGIAATVVQNNLFQANNVAGGASGSGVYSDTGLSNALIDNNRFSGQAFMAMVLVGTQSGITISDNQLVADGIEMYNTSASSITGNTISDTPGSSIYFGGGNAGVDVTGNTISGSAGGAVEIADPYGFGLNADISVQSN